MIIVKIYLAATAKSRQSCPTLCDPTDGSLPGSAIPGILQARTLEWVAISFSSAWKWKVKMKSLSCVWLSDRMDWSLPGFSIHGIFQARVLELGAIAFSVLCLTLLFCPPWYSFHNNLLSTRKVNMISWFKFLQYIRNNIKQVVPQVVPVERRYFWGLS